MIDLLPFNVLVYCIFPYLRDAEMRSLSTMNKKMNDLIHRYCLADKSSVKDLCQRGDLLIIRKRRLVVRDQWTFELMCERGYINLIKASMEVYRYDGKHYVGGLIKACRGGYNKIIKLLIENDLYCSDRITDEFSRGGYCIPINTNLMNKNRKYCCNQGLYEACLNNHRETVDLIISLSNNNELFDKNGFGYGLRGACQGGHREIVDLMISLLNNGLNNDKLNNSDIENWGRGLRGACRGGHREIIELMITLLDNSRLFIYILDRKINAWNEGLYGACRGGHLEIVELMIERGANDWDYGLGGACRGGHREIVELMFEKGADDCDEGLYEACRGGHREIVELMIMALSENHNDFELKNPGFWNIGLLGACQGGHREIIDLMIEKGANDWNDGLRGACQGGHYEIIELMIDNGAVMCEWCDEPVLDHL